MSVACTVSGIEVTQAIQNLANDVPLVSRKRTIVRVFIQPATGVRMRFHGTIEVRDAARRLSTVHALDYADVNVVPGETPAQQRLRLDGALNFELPPEATRIGICEISVLNVRRVDVEGALTVPPASVTVRFVEAPPLRLRLVVFRYQRGQPPIDHQAREIDLQLIESWLRRAFPVPDVIVRRLPPSPWPRRPLTSVDVNEELTFMRRSSTGGHPLERYYGVIADSGARFVGRTDLVADRPGPDAVACGPAGVPTDERDLWDTDGSYADWYCGHELGHTCGRHHVGACGEAGKDDYYPYSYGQLSDDESYVGFDVGDTILDLPMAVCPGTKYHDVMTYCSWLWISAYTYVGILDQLVAEARGPLPPTPELL